MKAEYTRTPYCCGLMEIGGFGKSGWGGPVTKERIRASRYAFICVTRWSDVTQKLTLKKWGFRRIGRWTNPNTGRVLTLWAYIPGQKKKKKEKK